MSLSIHPVLSSKGLPSLDPAVVDALRERAVAANEVCLAVQQALVLEARAAAFSDGDVYAGQRTVRQRVVFDLASSALSYRDQLVVAYARAAAEDFGIGEDRENETFNAKAAKAALKKEKEEVTS